MRQSSMTLSWTSPQNPFDSRVLRGAPDTRQNNWIPLLDAFQASLHAGTQISRGRRFGAVFLHLAQA
jgi:hypothetical protein